MVEPRVSLEELLAQAGVPRGEVVLLQGGDMGPVLRCGRVVVKLPHDGRPTPRFLSEARGLRALGAHVRVPEVLLASEHGLVMSWLSPGPSNPEALGRALATLHAVTAEHYGSAHPVYLGRWQMAAGFSDFTEDWWPRRLEPLLRATRGTLGTALARQVEIMGTQTPYTLEGPVMLHGDLWHGNVLHTLDGPALIDPAHWCGERAVDLAMMRLFGGFEGRCMAAYEEVLPVSPETSRAADCFQLLFLLVHVHFFGAAYVSQTAALLRRLC